MPPPSSAAAGDVPFPDRTLPRSLEGAAPPITEEGGRGSGTAVALRGIVKRYPRVVANDGVDLAVARGTIHALVGENGAGKSTLMKILYGMVRPDEGTLEIDGKAAAFAGPHDAIAAGIGMVHQHFMLVPPLTVYENIVLGSEPAKGWGVWDREKARAEVQRLSKEYGVVVDPDAKVETLSVGEEQRVEILKVLYRGAKILILDEPTAVLTPQECDELFATLRRLRDSGSTIIFISHKLKEVMSLCDAVTVIRRGKTVGSRAVKDTNREELAQLMIGELKKGEDKSAFTFKGAPSEALRLEKVSVSGLRGERALDDVSLVVKAGEILGVAGVEGNGQRELAQVVCGLMMPEAGRAALSGRVGYVPEDRHKAGLMLGASAWENMILGRHGETEFSRPWAFKRPEIEAFGRRVIADYDLRPPELGQPAGAFSGGNQQKIIVGRELSKEPALVVAAHPTRGVDLAASQLIHNKILEAKRRGAGILLITADLDELLALSDRVLVLFSGRVMGEMPAADATVEKLGLWMAGVA